MKLEIVGYFQHLLHILYSSYLPSMYITHSWLYSFCILLHTSEEKKKSVYLLIQNLWNGWMLKLQKEDFPVALTVFCICMDVVKNQE